MASKSVGSAVRWLLLGCLLFLACRAGSQGETGSIDGGTGSTSSPSERELIRLRDEARLVLEENCGACHTSHYDTQRPNAIAVFDLARPDWAEDMTEAQLESAAWRLTQDRAPGGHDGVPLKITPPLRDAFVRYKDALLAARQMDLRQEARR